MSSLAVPSFQPPVRTLMGPGPSDVHPRVLAALAKPTLGHLDPVYLQLMNGLQDSLRKLFNTQNPMTMAISGTGSAGMETCVVNLIEPGDAMIVCVNGVFGSRMADVAERSGAKVTKLERPWGEVFTADEVRQALSQTKAKVVGIVMAETSTGVATVGRNLTSRPRRGRIAVSRFCHFARRRAGGRGWLADRRDLLGDAKMPKLPARSGARVLQPRSHECGDEPEDESAELVSRCDDAGKLLGDRASLSSHRRSI